MSLAFFTEGVVNALLFSNGLVLSPSFAELSLTFPILLLCGMETNSMVTRAGPLNCSADNAVKALPKVHK